MVNDDCVGQCHCDEATFNLSCTAQCLHINEDSGTCSDTYKWIMKNVKGNTYARKETVIRNGAFSVNRFEI